MEAGTVSLVLALTACATAVLSGVFGMAGGMILMGAYAALLSVPAAMVLHGATQMFANGLRAGLLLREVYWRGLCFYVIGSLGAFALLFRIHFVPNPISVLLCLGLAPFVAAILPARWLDFERPVAAAVCGSQVAGLQLIAGAAGPLLDVAFVDTRLSRKQVVATKAVTQVFSHALKLVYFIPLAPAGVLTGPRAVAIVVATLCGTVVGTRLLERLDEGSFRRWSRLIVYAIGFFYLYQAGALWLLTRTGPNAS